ncbi:MAG: beta-agarase [Thermoguttaceae bacterium]
MFKKLLLLSVLQWTCLFLSLSVKGEERLVLLDSQTPLENILMQDVTVEKEGDCFIVRTGTENTWPGIQLNGPWNCREYGLLLLDVENLDETELTLNCRIDQPSGDGGTGVGTLTQSIQIPPRETKIWRMFLPIPVAEELREKFFAMRGNPFSMQDRNGPAFDRSVVTELRLFVNEPDQKHRFGLRKISAESGSQNCPYSTIPIDQFFPMIDTFGQFMHKDWPGKIRDEADLQGRIQQEEADLARHPGPENWNQYGGWLVGPQLQATGHFRTEKVDGKWFLVDPDGRLFWSHGVDCISDWNGTTPITDREFYFADLPDSQSPLALFYGTADWSVHNYYEGKGPYKTFNFTASNLFRKFGEHWKERFAQLAHHRLRSWGMNTIANWSDSSVYLLRKTPYTATISANCPPLQGSEGYWGKFADPFHEDFRTQYRQAFESQKETTANDPWCMGYFVDNEISWGTDRSLSNAAITSPADQPAKIALCDWLKQKYDGSIEKMNSVWKTSYSDWNHFLESTERPKRGANADLQDFYSVIAEQYFRVLREELKRTAPNKLYLGCRFAWGNPLAIQAAGKYCDVISFNEYKYDLDRFKLPKGVDKPCIIGEFHFGALDRGLFHTGLCPTESQDARAAAYEKYLLSALRHPNWVGTHWFQYGDQATTGRGDGENYQIGLLDVCDSPYPETISTLRKIGYHLYELRLGK